MTRLKKYFALLTLASLIAAAVSPIVLAAASPPVPGVPATLSFAEVRITGDEYIVLQNNTSEEIKDLSVYSLKTFNNVNPAATGVTSNVQQLPSVSLALNQRLLLSSTIRPTCGATVAGKLSLSLLDGGGALQLLRAGVNPAEPGQTIDNVSWSSGANGQIQNVASSAKAPLSIFYRYATASTTAWQPAELDAAYSCRLNVTVTSGSGTIKAPVVVTNAAQANDSAPATIIYAQENSAAHSPAEAGFPDSDVGLLAPEITELLPNPSGSGNDATDEYIELYNPNDLPFDLSGFTLQTGTSNLHDFTFSTGSQIAAKSFQAFYSLDTGLSLSNNGSLVKLLSPTGITIVRSDSYGTAKDGQTWALAKGKWYWSLTPTPGSANIVTLAAARNPSEVTRKPLDAPVTKSRLTTGLSTAPKKAAAVKGIKSVRQAKPAKEPKAKKPKAPKQKTVAITPTAASVTARPIQGKIVALVAGLAVLYGAYEYRADLANGIYKLRTNLRDRLPNRR